MYTDSTSVTSQLVDGIAWDTIVQWYENTQSGIAQNSKNFGNYGNNYNITATNALYALHLYRIKNSSGAFFTNGYASKYKLGEITTGVPTAVTTSNCTNYGFEEDVCSDTSYTYYLKKELATGVSDLTKIKNIYDMAGNMYEWTTEEGKHGNETSSTIYVVIRGGSFNNNGGDCPVSYRAGDCSNNNTNVHFGFRVILYVK